MRLTWRDGATSLLLVSLVIVAFAVVGGWDWPMLGSVRAGVGAALVIGMAMCILGSRFESDEMVKDPFLISASVLGTAALVLAAIGLITGSEAVFVALVGITAALWVVATTRHAVEGGHHAPAHPVGA
jgi:hypothetical protein